MYKRAGWTSLASGALIATHLQLPSADSLWGPSDLSGSREVETGFKKDRANGFCLLFFFLICKPFFASLTHTSPNDYC